MISPAVERAARLAWPMLPPGPFTWEAYMRASDTMIVISTAVEPYSTEDDIYYLHWLGETAQHLYLEEIRRG